MIRTQLVRGVVRRFVSRGMPGRACPPGVTFPSKRQQRMVIPGLTTPHPRFLQRPRPSLQPPRERLPIIESQSVSPHCRGCKCLLAGCQVPQASQALRGGLGAHVSPPPGPHVTLSWAIAAHSLRDPPRPISIGPCTNTFVGILPAGGRARGRGVLAGLPSRVGLGVLSCAHDSTAESGGGRREAYRIDHTSGSCSC